jgi:hypothetical protein
MRTWRFWLHTLILSSQYNPPRFIELVMLLLAMTLLGIWQIVPNWPYLVLSLSYVVGASISILVREAIALTPAASHTDNGNAIVNHQHIWLCSAAMTKIRSK